MDEMAAVDEEPAMTNPSEVKVTRGWAAMSAGAPPPMLCSSEMVRGRGAVVLWASDYDALQAELAALRRENEELKSPPKAVALGGPTVDVVVKWTAQLTAPARDAAIAQADPPETAGPCGGSAPRRTDDFKVGDMVREKGDCRALRIVDFTSTTIGYVADVECEGKRSRRFLGDLEHLDAAPRYGEDEGD